MQTILPRFSSGFQLSNLGRPAGLGRCPAFCEPSWCLSANSDLEIAKIPTPFYSVWQLTNTYLPHRRVRNSFHGWSTVASDGVPSSDHSHLAFTNTNRAVGHVPEGARRGISNGRQCAVLTDTVNVGPKTACHFARTLMAWCT